MRQLPRSLLCGWAILGLVVVEVGSANAQLNYTYTLLDVPGSIDTNATGINNAGQVVGWYIDANSQAHGFLYSGGTYTTLDPPGSVYSLAYGINDAGQVVGWYQKTSLLANPQGFLLSGGTYTNIVPPGATGTMNSALAINNAGQIVGQYGPFGDQQSFLLSGGSYTKLDQPGSTYTTVSAINNLGQILGASSLGPFLLSGGAYAPLSVLGYPLGINDADQIVGEYTYQDTVEGFILNDGVYTLLNVPGSQATEAEAINNAGQIVGDYGGTDGSYHAYLATPVPEPPSLRLVGLAALLLIALSWLRRLFSRRRSSTWSGSCV